MPEYLEIYNLKGKFLHVKERSQYFKEIKEEYAKKGKVKTQVKRSTLLLSNSKGHIVIQRRNKHKHENPGIYDKTIGGHVEEGDTFNLTMIKECAEELGFPASILSNKEFNKAITNTDLRVVGLFRKVETINNFQSVRITKSGESFVQLYIHTTYIGYYDGPIQFIDGESSGIQLFSIEDLKEDIRVNPTEFTEDLKFMVNRYGKYLIPIKKKEKKQDDK